jgi:hypothetical protein
MVTFLVVHVTLRPGSSCVAMCCNSAHGMIHVDTTHTTWRNTRRVANFSSCTASFPFRFREGSLASPLNNKLLQKITSALTILLSAASESISSQKKRWASRRSDFCQSPLTVPAAAKTQWTANTWRFRCISIPVRGFMLACYNELAMCVSCHVSYHISYISCWTNPIWHCITTCSHYIADWFGRQYNLSTARPKIKKANGQVWIAAPSPTKTFHERQD